MKAFNRKLTNKVKGTTTHQIGQMSMNEMVGITLSIKTKNLIVRSDDDLTKVTLMLPAGKHLELEGLRQQLEDCGLNPAVINELLDGLRDEVNEACAIEAIKELIVR